MKFLKHNNLIELCFICYKTSLYLAVEKENYEIVKSLLANHQIDPNIPYILC